MEQPTGSVTFLFTDIEGSTKLLGRLGDRYADVLVDHFGILRDALAAHGGVEQGTEGDSLFAVFPGATRAVRAAVESQRALGEHDWPNSEPVRVRMGLHSGEATVGHDGYVGLDVHRAARISSVAHGGQIVASSSTVALSEQALPDDIGFTDLGAHRLKDLSLPEHLSQVVADGLEADFPPLRSLDAVPHNLPIQLTHFIGRDTELAEALGKLEGSRLLTLTGVGGTGKTRLALQAAAAAVHDFPDGVWMVDLGPVSEADMVHNALAAAMGVRDQPGRTLLEAIEDALRNKTTLIILDNCEHLLEVSAQVSAALLRASSDVKILATSREALGIAGEATYPVPSLSAPPASATTADAVKRYDSAVMFEDRALLARPDFAVTDANAEAIAKICRRLDAVPLAIELAAARVRVLSPAEIADRLDDRFRLLTGGDRTALPRQQTLEAAVAWSHEHLSETERVLFARLSVFAGSFTLRAAECVTAAGDIAEHEVLDLVTGLVDKSMLIVQTAGAAETRYRLLETLRQYARDRLIEYGAAEEFRKRHASFFAGLAETGDPMLRGQQQRFWFDKLAAEHDNFTTALTWSLGAREPGLFLRIAASLGYLWSELGHWEEARRWLLAEPVFDDEQPARLRAEALTVAVPVIVPEDPERARDLARMALELSRATDDEQLAARALHNMGYATIHMFQPEAALPLLEEARDVYTRIGDRWGEALVLGTLANALSYLESNHALETGKQSLSIFREIGDGLLTAEGLYRQAAIAVRHARPDPAIEWLDEAIELYEELGTRVGLGHSLQILGEARAMQGGTAEARDAFHKSLRLLSEAGDAHCSARVRRDLGSLDLSEGDVSSARNLLREALAESARVGDKLNTAWTLEVVGRLVAVEGDPEKGAVLLGAADGLRDTISAPRIAGEELEHNAVLEELQDRLDDHSFEDAWNRGRALDGEAAVAYALE